MALKIVTINGKPYVDLSEDPAFVKACGDALPVNNLTKGQHVRVVFDGAGEEEMQVVSTSCGVELAPLNEVNNHGEATNGVFVYSGVPQHDGLVVTSTVPAM